MSKQNRFAGLASGLMAQVMTEAVALTQEQALVRKEFVEAKKALQEQEAGVELGRREAVRAIDETAQAQKQQIQTQVKSLYEAYEGELIRLGVKKEDIPLIERGVVKVADNAAKTVLASVGRFGAYIKKGIEQGQK
jgi:hypothetical protein